MSRYYYFYKDVTKDNKWWKWEEIDSGSYVGIPYVNEYGCRRIKPNCTDCVFKEQHENHDWMVEMRCCECWNDHNTFCVTRPQAVRIQNDMECNKTIFTDLMDKIGKDWIWIKYD